MRRLLSYLFFFFNDTATTEIYTLSLHDALPIFEAGLPGFKTAIRESVVLSVDDRLRIDFTLQIGEVAEKIVVTTTTDRKSTRLNSSHLVISYAVFCLKKKKTNDESSHALRHCRL